MPQNDKDRLDEVHIEFPLNPEKTASVSSVVFYKLICHKVALYIKSRKVSRKYASGAQVHHVPEHQERDSEDKNSGYPIPFCIIIISVIQITTYLCDVISCEDYDAFGSAGQIFVYDSDKRVQIWRYITYMLVHLSFSHIARIIALQVLQCVPFEMVHCWWRVLVIYITGVLAGSLATSILNPKVFLAGASGGLYAVIFAHMSSVVMKRSELRYASLHLAVFFASTACYILVIMYENFILGLEDQISYATMFSASSVGFLMGFIFLHNLQVKEYENLIQWISFVCCCTSILPFII